MQVSVSIRVAGDAPGDFQDFDVALSDVALAKVLFDFNVTADKRVMALKALSAAQIQMMLDHQSAETAAGAPSKAGAIVRAARIRAAAVAITQVELTQMPLVKSLFAKA